MNAHSQKAVFATALVLTVIYAAVAYWLISNRVSAYLMESNVGLLSTWRMLALNEWGDFLAGVCGPLALIWVIASVIMQGMELSEQRAEMAKQANALETQASYIERELNREEEDKCWHDILELLETLREMVPIAQGGDKDDEYVKFEFDGGPARFKYSPPGSVELDNMSTILFLGRAAGGISYSLKGLEPALSKGMAIQCPKGPFKFQRMMQIVHIIDTMAADLSESRKIVLAGCRLKDWRDHLELVSSVYQKHGDTRVVK
ncbi:hypothetical protein J3U99_14455 [Brucella pituitosa]|uniref:hypothetical protein n=1 Tax=Brucella pituitosa TaxID=571256 RepID=UPI002004E1F6|nr:hypothetical protein [Brucella pituitosa]MCK4205975.1 hypothetical protein [Brucella pituitosa]